MNDKNFYFGTQTSLSGAGTFGQQRVTEMQSGVLQESMGIATFPAATQQSNVASANLGVPNRPSNEGPNFELSSLRGFLRSAPHSFVDSEVIKRFTLPNGDHISCIRWNSFFFITGTDIVKVLFFRFALIGQQIVNHKKFEEGIFSDLRNLKPGIGSLLEEPKSQFLEFLHRNGCIRTQKKQKVFFWNAVNHEQLFEDALERSKRRDKVTTTQSFAISRSSLQNAYLAGNPLLGTEPLITPSMNEIVPFESKMLQPKRTPNQRKKGPTLTENCFGMDPLAAQSISFSGILDQETTNQVYSLDRVKVSTQPSGPLVQFPSTDGSEVAKTQPSFNDPLDEILRDNMDSIFKDIGPIGADVFLNDPTQESWQI